MKDIINLRKFYENEGLTANRYSSGHFWESRYHNKRKTILQKFLKSSLSECKTFLDLGCGSGEYLSFAGEFVNYTHGLDISNHYLRRCKSRKGAALILGEFTKLPFQEQTFDCVLCSEVLEHIECHETAILELLRVSRKSILISTPNQGIFRLLMRAVMETKLAKIDAKVGHVNIVRFSELIARLISKEWQVSVSLTTNVTPPILDLVRFPRIAAPLVEVFEGFLNRLLPTMGSITVILLKRSSRRLFADE
jgi:SAM-dependent methyltransferase